MSGIAEQVEQDGFAILEGIYSREEMATLARELPPIERRAGLRNFLEVPAIRALAHDERLMSLARALVGSDAVPVRAVLFDKSERANWRVLWHQDLSVALSERREVEGFGPWSHKDGVLHALGPASLLERMIALRLHVDDCGAERGPLRVLPGTHRLGRLADDEIAAHRGGSGRECCASSGGVIVMRPLLLHASSSATEPGPRRVVHLEYGPRTLPPPLRWHSAHFASSR